MFATTIKTHFAIRPTIEKKRNTANDLPINAVTNKTIGINSKIKTTGKPLSAFSINLPVLVAICQLVAFKLLS
jgi:hypothetical protein